MNRDIVLGSLIGFFPSLVVALIVVGLEHRDRTRARRKDLILRGIHLAFESLSFTRSVLRYKFNRDEPLPSNPIDELMALAGLEFTALGPQIQKLHFLQQRFLGLTGVTADHFSRLGDEFTKESQKLVNDIVRDFQDLASSEQLSN